MKKILFLFAVCILSMNDVKASDGIETTSAVEVDSYPKTDHNKMTFQIKNIEINQYNTLFGYEVYCFNGSGKVADMNFTTEVWLSYDHLEELFNSTSILAAGETFSWVPFTWGIPIYEYHTGARIVMKWSYTLAGSSTVYTGNIEYALN